MRDDYSLATWRRRLLPRLASTLCWPFLCGFVQRMSGAAGKLRVLVLHGYASNPLAYARRVSALTKACSSVADFVFAPAPHQVRSLPSETNPEPGPVDPSLPLEKQARAWFMANDETGVYEGWADTARFLRDYFREHGPFDGILGFSQGACLTGMLAAALEHPDRVPALDAPLQEAPLKFAIAVSGFKPRDPAFGPLYETPIQVPMLHVLGRSDAVVDFGACTGGVAVLTGRAVQAAARELRKRPRRVPRRRALPADAGAMAPLSARLPRELPQRGPRRVAHGARARRGARRKQDVATWH